MKAWKKLAAALTGLCMAGTALLSVSALERHPLDLNDDSCFDMLDIICITKYLHGLPSNLVYDDAADLDGDGQVDVFDLGLLKHALFYGYDLGLEEESVLLSGSYTAQPVKTVKPDEQTVLGQTKFSLELLQEAVRENAGENVLLSPYSVSQALGMTANGAKGDTRAAMESVLGGSVDALNPALYSVWTNAPDNEDVKLVTANSIWVRDGFSVLPEFLQTNADYYAADAFSAPFDAGTKDEINRWVSDKTDKMISSILQKDPDKDTMLYLVNAVVFDAEWSMPYADYQVADEIFTAADGTEQTVKMMHDNVYTYLTDEHASGFLRCYKSDYAFAAILPEEGMTPEAYIEGLTPERLHTMLANPVSTKVITGLPQFEYDFGTSLSESLQNMGMSPAFLPDADFSGITDDPRGVYIADVLHKTHIEVTQAGTRAAAATAIEMAVGAALDPEPPKEVILDRPFVYAIVDLDTRLPIFIGTVNHI